MRKGLKNLFKESMTAINRSKSRSEKENMRLRARIQEAELHIDFQKGKIQDNKDRVCATEYKLR